MINFACRRFDLKEIIRCNFNLTKTELEIMLYLMKNSNKENSKNIKIELYTSRKSINKLNKKLINRVKGGNKTNN
jgi:predicted transcriptional regulator